jgi:hypothetical protein
MDYQQAIRSLAKVYEDSAASLMKRVPPLQIGADSAAPALSDHVREETVRVISGCPCFRPGFTPLSSDHLLAQLQRTITELDLHTRAKAGEAIEALLASIDERVKSQRDLLRPLCQDPNVRKRLKRRLGPARAGLVDLLIETVNPSQLGVKFRAASLGLGNQFEDAEEVDTTEDGLPSVDVNSLLAVPIDPNSRRGNSLQSPVSAPELARAEIVSRASEALLALVESITNRIAGFLRMTSTAITSVLPNHAPGGDDFLTALEQILADQPREQQLSRNRRAA